MCQDSLWVKLHLFHIQVLLYWGNLKKLAPNTQNHVRNTLKVIENLHLFISHQMGPSSVSLAIPALRILEYCDNLGKLGPNILNHHVQRQTKSNSKSSAAHLTSTEALLLFQSKLRVHQLYLPYGYFSIRTIWEIRPKYPQIIQSDTWKKIQSLQLYVLHQIRLYSSVKIL